ncbi:MAG: hypothetical protein KDC44_17625, partial [Phaeodactylibacter sp.]|nr:hypothetical protein [Phaeodactylibacter sp.]
VVNVNKADPTLIQDLQEIKVGVQNLQIDTSVLLSNQVKILALSEQRQADMDELFQVLDAAALGSVELGSFNAHLEENLDRYFAQLPPQLPAVKEWQATKKELPSIPDAKWKFKLKVPFVLGEFEKEVSWDVKKMLKFMRAEIMEVVRGERTIKELFIETD